LHTNSPDARKEPPALAKASFLSWLLFKVCLLLQLMNGATPASEVRTFQDGVFITADPGSMEQVVPFISRNKETHQLDPVD
jgi:hypothetical protein